MMVGCEAEGKSQMETMFEKSLQLMRGMFPEYFETSMLDRLEEYKDPKRGTLLIAKR